MAKYMFDLLVVGGGSGGVRAARWSRQVNNELKVGLIEMPYSPVSAKGGPLGENVVGGLGGTCVLRGCVPKKLLWYGGQFGHDLGYSRGYGWQTPESVGHTWSTLLSKKREEIARLNGVYEKMLRNAGVELIEGRGRLVDAHTVQVGEKSFTAETILLATGARPQILDIPGKEYVVSSDEMLELPETPKRLVVFGAGYIACEMACIFRGYGSEVDVVYRADLPLRGFDGDARKFIAGEMEKHGVKLHKGFVPGSVEKQDNGKYKVTIKGNKDKSQEQLFENVDVVLMATGRTPNTGGLGLEAAGVETEKGAVKVDDLSRTNVPNIYAIGDLTNRMMLTPVALHEAMCFVNTVYGGKPTKPCHVSVPSAVFTTPPMGVCGLTEEDAAKKYPEVDVYLSEFKPMIHTMSGSNERCMMKILVDAKSDKVLGMHIVGKDAAEIIQGFGAAMKSGITKSELDSTIGVHPSSAEELVTMRTKTRTARSEL